MSNQLYPPIINRSLPPIKKETNNTVITINFTLPSNVGINDFNKLSLKISQKNSNVIIYEKVYPYTIIRDKNQNFNFIIDNNGFKNKTENEKYTLENEQFYKIQIAFVNGNNIGYYSQTGLSKCLDLTSEDNYKLDFNPTWTDLQNGVFSGTYITNDLTEKVKNYGFTIFEKENPIQIFSSGAYLHETTFDEINNNQLSQPDSYDFEQTFKAGIEYTVEYWVETINGLFLKETIEKLKYEIPVLPPVRYSFNPIVDYDSGSIKVKATLKPFLNIENEGLDFDYKIIRANSKDNYNTWEILTNFNYQGKDQGIKTVKPFTDKLIFEDFTVEQGIKYRYGIQSKDRVLQIVMKEKNAIEADFEDMFLMDNEHILKIRYNPKVANFKTTILEQKVDTLGGRYPFFSRNGFTNYKEFSISGLISMLMDDRNLFMGRDPASESYRTSTYDNIGLDYGLAGAKTALSSQNIASEREFKLAVLNWLNNGKPKLFKSPAEGNYLIRLMNVSLSPNDTLGRMLHTFQCTAYEIDDYKLSKIKKYNLINQISFQSFDYDTINSHIFENAMDKFTNFETNKIISVSWPTGRTNLNNVTNLINLNPSDERFEAIAGADSISGSLTYYGKINTLAIESSNSNNDFIEVSGFKIFPINLKEPIIATIVPFNNSMGFNIQGILYSKIDLKKLGYEEIRQIEIIPGEKQIKYDWIKITGEVTTFTR